MGVECAAIVTCPEITIYRIRVLAIAQNNSGKKDPGVEFFDSGGVKIAYQIFGEGPPVLLVHGFASNGQANWISTGWVDFLIKCGRKVIVIDNRGHGASEKLYDPSLYDAREMARDNARLLDHLNIGKCDIIGYSMGARICAFLAIFHSEHVHRAVLAGLAYNMVRGFGRGEAIAKALEAATDEEVTNPEPRAFRRFAKQTGSDLLALAACMRSPGHKITMDMLARIKAPVLVIAGDKDDVAGPIEPLLEVIPGSRGVYLHGKDHMKAVGDPQFKKAVKDFFSC